LGRPTIATRRPLAQQLPLPGLAHQLLQSGAHRHEGVGDGGRIEGGQVVFKVEPGLQFGQRIEQLLAQGGDAALQATIEAGHRQGGGAAAAGIDHLHHRLRPGEVKAAVEEGPLAEFPRPCGSGARCPHQLLHPPHRLQTPVAVELHHVFAGEAAGGAHQQQQGLIHPIAAGGIHHMAVEDPVALPLLAARHAKEQAADRLRARPR
jgi:hypothetical protein